MDSSTALTRTSTSRSELALPVDIVEQAREFAINSRSARTQKEYERCWRQFETWCDKMGQAPLPATVQTLIAYVTDLASNGGPKGKPLSASSIQQALSALILRHSMVGAPTEQFSAPILKEVLKGIRRKIAATRSVRRVRPLMETQLADLLDLLRPESLLEARDAAILGLGFGAARRRSELAGLDYMERGPESDARGILVVDDRGLTIKLSVSKTNQEGAEEEYVVPRMAAPRICQAVEHWIEKAGIRKGEPVFRPVGSRGHSKGKQSGYPGVTWRADQEKWQAVIRHEGKTRFLGYFKTPADAHAAICQLTGQPKQEPFTLKVGDKRISEGDIARVVKTRVGQLLRSQSGKKRVKADEIEAIVAQFSGHSMRSGHVTSASDRGVPTHRIKAATGHKSDAMIGVYSRVSDKTRNSSLKGSGL